MEIIDIRSSEVQNATSDNVMDMLLRGGRIESDVDNQLVINLSFHTLSQLKNIIFTVPSRDEGPTEVRLFANKFIDFDDAEDFKPTMKVGLEKKYTGVKDQKIIIPLDRNFISVSKLGIYIPESDSDKTVITRLTLEGARKTGGINKPLERC